MKRILKYGLQLFEIAILSLLFVSCNKDGITYRNSPDNYADKDNARILSVHAAPDGPQLDFFFDQVKIAAGQPSTKGLSEGLAYNKAGVQYIAGYASIKPGTGLLRFVSPTAETTISPGTLVYSQQLVLDQGKTYSIFATGPKANISALVLEDKFIHPDKQASVRFINLLSGSPNLKLTYNFTEPGKGQTVAGELVSGLGYKESSVFLPIAFGQYVFQVKNASTGANIGAGISLAATTTKSYSVLVRGVMGSSATPPVVTLITHNK